MITPENLNGDGSLLDYALACLAAGYSVVPTDSRKLPAFSLLPRTDEGKATWEPFQTTKPTGADLMAWFSGKQSAAGYAIVGGAVSGNSETIDFDLPDNYPPETAERTFREFSAKVEAIQPGLMAALSVTKTKGGGFHLRYRSESTVDGNMKLAAVPAVDAAGELQAKPDGTVKPAVLIETRGEGGYSVGTGTPGYVHVSGPKPWDAPTITTEERDILLSVARSFDQLGSHVSSDPDPGETSPEESTGSGRPGDDFNQRGDWEPLLNDLGLKFRYEDKSGCRFYQRIGSENPVAANLGYAGKGLLKVFSENLAIPAARKAYSKFAVFTLLYHAGDFSAAAADLRQQGYGGSKCGHAGNGSPQKPLEIDPSVTVTGVEQFQTFPIEALPQPVRGFVEAGSKSIGCDESFIAAPLLVACAACIGNTRVVRLKPGWDEPAIIWGGLVADSGSHKSPALALSLKAVRKLQHRKIKEHAIDHANWSDHEMVLYEAALSAFKKSKSPGASPPRKPEEPIAWRIAVDDITIESLGDLLSKQPRGLLLAVDELSAWLGAMERYKKGSDVSKWLEVFHARPLTIDRKSSKKPIYIPNASVSVLGGIQPETYKRMMTQEFRTNGMSARLLVWMPPRRPRKWTDACLHPAVEASIEQLVARLLTLEMEPGDEDIDDPTPRPVGLSAEAKELFVAFFNEHAEEQSELTGELSATWSKLEAYAPRLALVHHLVRWANGEIPPEREYIIDAESMVAGITLVRWFAHEARRVHAMLSETREQAQQRELTDWIRRRGGRVSVRDLMHGKRRYRQFAELARSVLDDLQRSGFGSWESTETGGRPADEFILHDNGNGNTSPKNQLKSDPCVTTTQGSEANLRLGERYFTNAEIADVRFEGIA